VNSTGLVFGPRPLGSSPTQRPIWQSRPKLAGVCRCGHCVRAKHGGAAVAGTVPGLHGEHRQFLGSAPGKEVGAGAHPDVVAMTRHRFTVWWQRFIICKLTRWLKVEVEGSCSTGRLRGGVRHDKSDETELAVVLTEEGLDGDASTKIR
jgi:hypothetical protein